MPPAKTEQTPPPDPAMDAIRAAEQACPYPETADIETSSDVYAGRFAGPAGQWMLEVQERLTLDLLRQTTARTILDVGGGHGQLARPLVREGYEVTVLGSHPSCAHRIQDLIDAGSCRFEVGNVISLPHADQAFDAVIAFRLLTHCQAWPTLVQEVCRVARNVVIVDYPTSQSLNAIAPLLFEAKKKVEVNTRTWTLFRHRNVRESFTESGFRLARQRGQFFFPMVVHRMLKRRELSHALESVTGAFGLNRALGSPVIARFERLS